MRPERYHVAKLLLSRDRAHTWELRGDIMLRSTAPIVLEADADRSALEATYKGKRIGKLRPLPQELKAWLQSGGTLTCEVGGEYSAADASIIQELIIRIGLMPRARTSAEPIPEPKPEPLIQPSPAPAPPRLPPLRVPEKPLPAQKPQWRDPPRLPSVPQFRLPDPPQPGLPALPRIRLPALPALPSVPRFHLPSLPSLPALPLPSARAAAAGLAVLLAFSAVYLVWQLLPARSRAIEREVSDGRAYGECAIKPASENPVRLTLINRGAGTIVLCSGD